MEEPALDAQDNGQPYANIVHGVKRRKGASESLPYAFSTDY